MLRRVNIESAESNSGQWRKQPVMSVLDCQGTALKLTSRNASEKDLIFVGSRNAQLSKIAKAGAATIHYPLFAIH